VRVKTGPALVMCTSSRAESQLWVGAITSLLATVPADIERGALLLELLSDGAARVNLRKKFNRRERKAREAFTASRMRAAKRAGPLSEGAAIAVLQRAMRGHAARNMVRGWVKVKDDSGDVYYYNINSGKSEWKAPWHGGGKGGAGGAAGGGGSSGAGVGAGGSGGGAPAPAADAPPPVSAPPVSAPPVSAPPAPAPAAASAGSAPSAAVSAPPSGPPPSS